MRKNLTSVAKKTAAKNKKPFFLVPGFLARGTGQPPQPEAPAPLAAPHPALIHDDHDLSS
jgi:hypothetical protein